MKHAAMLARLGTLWQARRVIFSRESSTAVGPFRVIGFRGNAAKYSSVESDEGEKKNPDRCDTAGLVFCGI